MAVNELVRQLAEARKKLEEVGGGEQWQDQPKIPSRGGRQPRRKRAPRRDPYRGLRPNELAEAIFSQKKGLPASMLESPTVQAYLLQLRGGIGF